jgi:hypothetical protein
MLSMTLNNIRVEGTDYYPLNANEDVYEEYRNYANALREAYETVTLVDNFENPEDYENALYSAAGNVREPAEPLPSDAYYYFQYYMPMLQQNSNLYENFSVDFFYLPDFGIDIQAKPSSDGILKSTMMEGSKKYLSFFCINFYHFVYDITYPVLITLNDPDALGGRGYSFRFAFPVIIRNNEGLRYRQYMDFVSTSPVVDDYCHDGTGRGAIVRVYDKAEGSVSPITDVNVTMICANKKCPLGKTHRVGADSVLRINLTTSCSNPYIEATKEGYLRGIYTIEDWETRIDVEMVKLKNFTIDLRKHRLNIVDNSLGPGQHVSDGEVTISLSGYLDGEDRYDETFIIIPGEENIIELPIIDAEYEVSIIYTLNNEDFTGGYFLDWDVDKTSLMTGNKIRFHFVEMITSTLEEDAARTVGALQDISSPDLNPVIS